MSSDEDLTGQSRFVRNLVTGWLAQLVVLVSGFILPRLIHESVGQQMLGVWDLGWSTVRYLAIANFGVAAALNRYVALYRASGESERLDRAVSSVIAWQFVMSLVVLAVIMLLATSQIVESADPEVHRQFAWVVTFLGLNIFVNMLFGPVRGTITGAHRSDLNNTINASADFASAVLMIVALLLGGGIADLAFVALLTSVAAVLARVVVVRRVVPELAPRWRHVRATEALELLRFGLKTMVADLPRLVSVQSLSILLAAFAGPAALAILARPLALATQIEHLINRFTFLLTPMTSGLVGLDRRDELQAFAISHARLASLLAGGALLALGVYGDLIILLWMGEAYVRPWLPALVAAGMFLPVTQSAMFRILAGLNAHGRASVWSLLATLAVVVLGLTVRRPETPETAAVIIGVSLTAGPGIVMPLFACRALDLNPLRYAWRAIAGPSLLLVIVGAVMLGIRHLLPGWPGIAGAVPAGLVFLAGTWFMFLTDNQRERALALARRG